MTNPPNATPSSPPAQKTPEGHLYVKPNPSDSRSPCPALNTLANHGYIPQCGREIGFMELIDALQHVYNLSWFLAFFLTLVGFVVSGKITFASSEQASRSNTSLSWIQMFMPIPRWSLDLGSLSERGPRKLAHDASLVHPNRVPSHAPDNDLLEKLLSHASSHHGNIRGLSLIDIALYHKKRESELANPLNSLHKKVALGECGLVWAVMRRKASMEQLGTRGCVNPEWEDVITEDVLRDWMGFERLPHDWWIVGGSRPGETIGLLEAQRRASDVAKIIAE